MCELLQGLPNTNVVLRARLGRGTLVSVSIRGRGLCENLQQDSAEHLPWATCSVWVCWGVPDMNRGSSPTGSVAWEGMGCQTWKLGGSWVAGGFPGWWRIVLGPAD